MKMRAVEAYEIGYCVSKAQQRKGFGYEAVKAVCDCLLNTLHTDMLIAGAIEKNTASAHMLQKLGFSFEGRRTKGFYHPDGEYAGYVVCRIDNEVVWLESIFVREEYRRRGVASALHSKAEEIAASYGNDTVYNCVHPNNHRMIAFLRKRSYTS